MTVQVSCDSDEMNAAVDHYLQESKVKSNGVREIPKAAFVTAMEKHGVTEADYKRMQSAIDFETTAAARVALADTEVKINSADKKDLENEEFRCGLSSTVRLPTFGGATEVSCQAEKWSNIPFRGEGDDAPSRKVTHGRFSTKINTKGRIYKDLHDEAANRIRAALGVKD